MIYMRIPPDLAHTLAVTVAEGSLDAAARALHITQPAVSQRLQLLERTTGQVLLVRSRPVRATPAGEAVIRYARQVEHLDADTALALGLDGDARPQLPIAVNADSLATWFLAPLARVTESLGVIVDLHRDDERYTADLLASGAVVAAVSTQGSAVPGCSVTPLGTMRYRAVASPAYVARHFADGVSAAALASAPVVDFDRKDRLQSDWLDAMGVDGALAPRHHVPSSIEFAQAIALGMGWGVVPDAQRALHPGLVDLGGPDVNVRLYWQRWRAPSALLDAVQREVTQAARAELAQAGGRG